VIKVTTEPRFWSFTFPFFAVQDRPDGGSQSIHFSSNIQEYLDIGFSRSRDEPFQAADYVKTL
jgi:hypothetical protein